MAKTHCTATAKSTGQPCRQGVVPGANVCRFHGGAAKQVRAKGQLRLAERQARELFGKIAPEIEPVENPLAAYAEFAGEVMAWKKIMHSLLDDLSSVGYEADTGEQVRAAVQLYERSMDRANTVLSAYARLNIDSRLASISKTQAETIMRAVEAVIAYLAPPADKADAAKTIAIRHLRAVEDAA